MHTRRLITAFLIIPLFLLCVFWDYGTYTAILLAFLFFWGGQGELYRLYHTAPRRRLLALQKALALVWMYFVYTHNWNAVFGLTFLFIVGSSLISMKYSLKGIRYEAALHFMCFMYLLIPLSSLVYLRSLEFGREYLFYVLCIACLSDSGAYYGGRLFGKHKMAPGISPGKTWEGTFFGTCTALFVMTVVNIYYFDYAGHNLLGGNGGVTMRFALVTIALSAIGHLGDLFESALKRDAGIKDSGSDVTGHGGYLDMMDALLWIAPAMAVYLKCFPATLASATAGFVFSPF